MPEPELDRPEPDYSDPDRPERVSPRGVPLSAESDLAKLVAKFTAHGGGNLPAELSVDLALEVVLNEIVEQACLASGATGAAVILEREGEMVCRASSGVNAPELGARLSHDSGLTAECIRTRQVQRCEDAAADPRVDVEACRSLGVRSMMILPLVRNGRTAGVLEIFSSRAGAFGARDEATLETLAQRIWKNLARADEPFGAGPQKVAEVPKATEIPGPAISVTGVEDPPWGSGSPKADGDGRRRVDAESAGTDGSIGAAAPARNPSVLDIVTFALGMAVVGCAVLLGTLIGVRMGWFGKTSTSHKASANVAEMNRGREAGLTPAAALASSSSLPAAAGLAGDGEKRDVSLTSTSTSGGAISGGAKESIPAGSLMVYEDGKEVFRMVPGGKATGIAVVEISPQVAEGRLVHRVEPDYPEEARRQAIQGPVVLAVRTGRDGAVQDVNVVSGNSMLAEAAMAAVKQWRFKPRVVGGQAVEMESRVTLNFRLPE